MEIVLKYKKQTNKAKMVQYHLNFLFAKELLCAKVITVKKLWSCVKFAWLSFKKIHVLTASSVSKNSVQITDINFLPTIS